MNDFMEFLLPGLPVSKEKQLARELIAEFKAPPDGHEFYGNQWTGGGGGGGGGGESDGGGISTSVYSGNLPSDGVLGNIAKDTVKKMEDAEINRLENENAFTYLSDQDLADRHGIMQRNYLRDKDNVPEEAKKWEERLVKIRNEENFRREYYNNYQRLAAIEKSNETGKVVITDGQVANLIGNTQDAYHDAGHYPEKGEEPRRELFKTSDLSGMPIRNYIQLPDGRIAHPDEIHESERRGRLLILNNIRVPRRDFTARK